MDYYKLLLTYQTKIDEYYQKIKQARNPNQEIKELYSFIKQIIPEFYKNGKMHISYSFIVDAIFSCEELLSKKFIIESTPNFYTKYEQENILDCIVYQVRKYLTMKYSIHLSDIQYLSFTNDCIVASKKVKEICESLNIESYIIPIYPGYAREAKLLDGNGYHYFNIIKLVNKYYLVDCTYRQFFTLKQNYLERLGIVNLSGCKVGTFMLMTEERKQLAKKILKDGWIELNEDKLKVYLDGFTLSFRNGLYYEETKDFSYKTKYSPHDYINFLIDEDNQILHEGKEVLGFQRKPLKDPYLHFCR